MKHIAEQFSLLPPAVLPPVDIGTLPVKFNVPLPAKKHHKYGPSRLGYLDECAGFVNRSGETAAAEEGTTLHKHMETILLSVVKGPAKSACEGLRILTMEIDLTDEEREYLRFCCLRADIYLTRKPQTVDTEISVSVSDENGKQLNHGTLDVAYGWGTVIIIQDFKFGWVPVKHARENLQGMNYALGIFQKYLSAQTVGVEFIQPKLAWISTTAYKRAQMAEIYERCALVIERAEFVQNNPEQAQKYVKPGLYCAYCEASGRCAMLSNHRAIAATKFNNLPVPRSFKGLELSKPEDIALARYYVDIMENGVKEIKQRAFEIAELNGGEIACTLPNGERIIYAIAEKNADRSLGSPIEVAEALKEFLTLEEVLGAAELAITKLEPIAKNALVESVAAVGRKITKKAAWEQIQSTLEAHGVLTRPDQKIRFLKRKKQVPKQIEQQSTKKE